MERKTPVVKVDMKAISKFFSRIVAKFQSGSANESNETELDANPQVNECIQFLPIKLFCISLASEIAQVISKS